MTTWTDFIHAHMSFLAGTDFFTVEVLTLRGLVTYYVLFFILLESRRVEVAGITPHWMKQIARNVTMEEWGFSVIVAILSMTAIRNSRIPFARSSNRATQSHSSFQPAVRI